MAVNYYLIISLFALFVAAYLIQEKKIGKGKDNFARYELVKDWFQLSDSLILGNPTGIGIDTNQNVFIFHRANREWPLIGAMPESKINSKTIILLDRQSGKLINSWGAGTFIMPHGLTVDKNNNVWVTDVGLNQVFKFTHDGNLLMTLGITKVKGNDSTHFDRPTDVAVADDGSFYVSDGYGNSRIIKFSADGKYLLEWGKKGRGEAEEKEYNHDDLDLRQHLTFSETEFVQTVLYVLAWMAIVSCAVYAILLLANTKKRR